MSSDRVVAQGRMESNGHTFRTSSLTVETAWKDTNPDQPFTPTPLNHAHQEKSGILSTEPVNLEAKNDTASSTRQEENDAQEEPGSLCKFWVNTGRCPKGGACRYSHNIMEGIGPVRTGWVENRRSRRRQAGVDPSDPHMNDALRKSNRAAVFCRWLVDTFGKENLCAGNGVLDVAGGRGAVSFELYTVHGIRSTLVDPRPQKLSRSQHRIVEQLGALYKPQGQIQAEFFPELWQGEGNLGERLRGCSLVVGMHPDQATDSIVDFAMEFGKDFAVVPCCVFPRLFPGRRVRNENGALDPVKTHPQLVQHLKQKAGAESEFLGFEGMNQVVFKKTQQSVV
ncbi:hypothetical protein BSKO_03847 [Bryopsis sp. KO-2023]|nr:hypothetical protein BSKO_03847 [Bryopsis sp. KO-2023]